MLVARIGRTDMGGVEAYDRLLASTQSQPGTQPPDRWTTVLERQKLHPAALDHPAPRGARAPAQPARQELVETAPGIRCADLETPLLHRQAEVPLTPSLLAGRTRSGGAHDAQA